MAMIVKTCSNCNVTCWHNPVAIKDRSPRCTYCGSPAAGNNGTPKRDHNNDVMKKQANRARLLGQTHAGVLP